MTGDAEGLYPNQPLVEVVFELRFPGNMAVECTRHRFWEKIRSDYGHIFVPSSKPNEPTALQPYRFERDDRSAGVAIAINRFALYVREYEGYAAFRTEFLQLLELFTDTFQLSKLNRAGWRYINVIPFVREAGVIPLGRILKLGLKVPDAIPETFSNLSLVFESKTPRGTVTTRLQSIETQDRIGGGASGMGLSERKPQDNGREALLLDLDFGCEGEDLVFANVPDYMEEAHDYTKSLFEALITDDYRTFLKGEVL